MKKTTITLSFDDEKMGALEFSLHKENASVQKKMEEALAQLYEKAVPEAVREYLDSKAVSASRPRRPAQTGAPRRQVEQNKTVAQEKEGSL